MPIEPTSIQRDRMLAANQKGLTLVQFLVVKNTNTIAEYLSISQTITKEEGGKRSHQLKIDQVLAGGAQPYQYLTVDSFPSSHTLLMAFERSREIRQDTLKNIYALVIKPHKWIPKITRTTMVLSPYLRRWLKTSTEKPLLDFANRANPDIDPVLETVEILRGHPGEDPFLMMNLNKYIPGGWKTQGRLVGKTSYNLYSARILPYLISVGGYPDLIGPVLSTFIGDQTSGIQDIWSNFALVYYPARANFLRLMTNTPKNAAKFRRKGLKRAVLMPCSRH